MGDNGRGKLYIVATPIGNLEDMSPRAVRTLKEADLIAAEDTRNSIRLLNHFEISTPMTSYHEFNKYEKAEELIRKMQEGLTVAVITDAGTPCISDPGEVLVEKCAEAGIETVSVPGASALITALTLSALPARRFVFEGFLPAVKQKKERAAALERIRRETRTIILYEAPHHLKATLAELAEVLGPDRRISLARELTKLHEEVIRTTLGEAASLEPRGEYVLVVEGMDEELLNQNRQASFEAMSLTEHLQHYTELGMARNEAMRAVASDRGLSKRDVYNALMKKESGL